MRIALTDRTGNGMTETTTLLDADPAEVASLGFVRLDALMTLVQGRLSPQRAEAMDRTPWTNTSSLVIVVMPDVEEEENPQATPPPRKPCKTAEEFEKAVKDHWMRTQQQPPPARPLSPQDAEAKLWPPTGPFPGPIGPQGRNGH